jgi:O-antigen/teichoic acid export membrane protein
MPSSSSPPIRSLRDRVLNAGSWGATGYIGAQCLRVVSSLVLTRLLTPDLFGLMAIVTVVQTILGLLSDVGLRQAVIQNPRGTEPAFLATVWVMQVVRSGLTWTVATLIGIGLWLLSAVDLIPAGSVYGDPKLPLLLFATGAVYFVESFHSVKVLEQQRLMSLRQLTLVTLAVSLIGLVATIAFALVNRSIWAIVAGGLVQAIAYVILSHKALPGTDVPFRWDLETVKEITRFGRWIILSSTLFILSSNADRLLLASWVSADLLGYYSIAQSLIGVALGAGESVASMVVFPALSDAAREGAERFRSIYRRFELPSNAAYLLASGFVFGVAEWVVRLLYDPRYEAAGPMLRALSLSLALSRLTIATHAYVARGKVPYNSLINGANLACTWVLIPVLYYSFGLEAAIYGIALRNLPALPLTYYFNARLGIGSLRGELLPWLAWPLGAALGLGVALAGDWVR